MSSGRERVESAVRADSSLKVVPYVMAGFPTPEASLDAARSLVAGGAAALEIGVPFSDPLADGPVIQRAGQVALEHGMTPARCLELAAQVAGDAGAPILLMTYLNPVLAHGLERFAEEAAKAGVAGVIVPDLPADESREVRAALEANGLACVFLVAPTSTRDRIRATCAASSGFVYCVTVTGTTGVRTEIPAGLQDLVREVRNATQLPVAAGFGISSPDQLSDLRGLVDAAVVGSAIVREQAAGRDPARLLESLVRSAA